MIEMSSGLLMLIIGGAGAGLRLIFLIATGTIFQEQKKKLLEKLQVM